MNYSKNWFLLTSFQAQKSLSSLEVGRPYDLHFTSGNILYTNECKSVVWGDLSVSLCLPQHYPWYSGFWKQPRETRKPPFFNTSHLYKHLWMGLKLFHASWENSITSECHFPVGQVSRKGWGPKTNKMVEWSFSSSLPRVHRTASSLCADGELHKDGATVSVPVWVEGVVVLYH